MNSGAVAGVDRAGLSGIFSPERTSTCLRVSMIDPSVWCWNGACSEQYPTSGKTPPAETMAPAMAKNDSGSVYRHNRNYSAAARCAACDHSAGSKISERRVHFSPVDPLHDIAHVWCIPLQCLQKTRLLGRTVAVPERRGNQPRGALRAPGFCAPMVLIHP